VQGEGHEPDMRGGTVGPSGHATVKSSIPQRAGLDTSGVYARTVGPLTTGGLPGASGRGVPRQWAERRVNRSDPRGGVSRGHRRPAPRGPQARTEGRRDRAMLARSTAPAKPLRRPFADRRGDASVGASGGDTPVTDDDTIVVPDCSYRTAVYVIRMYGGVGGVRP
jgi:hypothetical protein